MNEHMIFDINRAKLLLTRQLRLNTSTILIGFGAAAGVVTFILSLQAVFSSGGLNFVRFGGLPFTLFFIGGYIFTSTIFSELRSSHRGYLYLTLPASTLEKLLVAWFISSILYIAASIVVLYVINLLVMLVAFLSDANPVPLYNLFDWGTLRIFAIYMVTQTVFLLGAIYFRGVNFLKTLLALFVIDVAIAIIVFLLARIIVFHDFRSIHFGDDSPESLIEFFENIFVPAVKILFWYCQAPFFLVVSYYRLKERQV